MTWSVSIHDDEIMLEYRSGLNHILVCFDEDGPSYAIRENSGFMSGKFDLEGKTFKEAIAEIKAAMTRC